MASRNCQGGDADTVQALLAKSDHAVEDCKATQRQDFVD
jgi:hypothetical protein